MASLRGDTLGFGNGARSGGAYGSSDNDLSAPRLPGPFGLRAGAGFHLTRLALVSALAEAPLL